ncbi:hypothetical protein WA171_001521, partial [Blastocystis sp. BT1]
MTIRIFQCSQCKRIVADENCILDVDVGDMYIVLSSISGCEISPNIQLSTEGFDCGCSYKDIRCSCKNAIGRQIIAVPEGKIRLRHYVIYKSQIIEYTVQKEEEELHLKDPSKPDQMYYYVGEDAKRAATFLTELHEVERMILDLENRMNKLT